MSFAGLAAVLGWLGALALLVGYWAVSTNRIRADGAPFQGLNVFGSGGLGVAAVAGRVWSAAALNLVWVVIGVVILGRLARRRSDSSLAATTTVDHAAPARSTDLDCTDLG
jgi:hypothetical protein